MWLGMGHSNFEIGQRGESRLSSAPGSSALRSKRWRWLAISLAIGALYPLALTTSLSHGSGSLGLGSGQLWSVQFHNVVNRPTLPLAATAVVLWIAAAALWASSSALTTVVAVGVAVALSTVCVLVTVGDGSRNWSVVAAMVGTIRLGESESRVLATLGPAPDVGTASRLDSGGSLPCLVYNTSATGLAAFCFRDGKLALK